jgi:ribonuclease VapC
MVLDTSAIVATVTNEPDGQRYRKAMLDAASLSMSAVAILETKIVLSARFGASAVKFFDELLETAGIVVVPFDADMAKGAFEAFQRFGKGRGTSGAAQHRRLCGLRLAKARSQPLLFKGADFAKTDILPALT